MTEKKLNDNLHKISNFYELLPLLIKPKTIATNSYIPQNYGQPEPDSSK